MGDFQNQQVGAEQDDVQNRGPQTAKAESPAVAEVRAMLASGVAHPTGVARVMLEHPAEIDKIMALVHKTMGNEFAMELVEAMKRDPKKQQGRTGTLNQEEMRAMTDDKEEAPAPSKYGLALSKGHALSKDKTDALTADALENEDPDRAQANPAPSKYGLALSKGHALSKDKTDALTADLLKDDPRDPLRAQVNDFEAGPKNDHAEVKTDPAKAKAAALIADTDDKTLGKGPVSAQESGVKDESPKEAKAPDVAEAPVEASKILKDETVIGASKEEKPVEIVRQSEVLKDPQQNPEEPKKASDEVKDQDKDHDGESESEGGGTKHELGPVKITASVLRVRSSPKIGKGNIVGRLTRDTVVEAIGHQGEWVEIQFKGQTAFIHSSFVAGAKEEPAPNMMPPERSHSIGN